jgi:hypothetical protein
LKQNLPNPFNNSSVINFEIQNEGHYKLVVFDLFGNPVKILLDKNLAKGLYSVVIERGDLATGTYFYSLVSASSRETKPMLIVE